MRWLAIAELSPDKLYLKKGDYAKFKARDDTQPAGGPVRMGAGYAGTIGRRCVFGHLL